MATTSDPECPQCGCEDLRELKRTPFQLVAHGGRVLAQGDRLQLRCNYCHHLFSTSSEKPETRTGPAVRSESSS